MSDNRASPLATTARTAAALAAPTLFVLLWSTGAPMAKLGAPHADPISFLATRFGLAAALLWLWSLALRALAPPRERLPDLALVGALTHGVYLGGLFTAIALGLNAGLAALIAGLSPLFVAMIAGALGWERISRRRAFGLGAGFAGAALALSPALTPTLLGAPAASAQETGPETMLLAVAICFAATLALAIGSVLQRRRLGAVPLVAGALAQYLAATALMGALWAAGFAADAPLFFTPEPPLLFALAWQVLLLSIGAIMLYYWMLRRGEASSVSSLMFLTPGFAALTAWALFGERLGGLEIAGFLLAMLGVFIATSAPRAAAAP